MQWCIHAHNDEYDEPLGESLSPLLRSMHVFGQYFQWPFGDVPSETTRKRRTVPADSEGRESFSNKFSVICAIILLVLMWMNAARLLTIFTPSDTNIPAILNKLVIATWHVQVTIQQTSFFIACRSGRLDRVLEDIRLKRASCSAFVHRLAAKVAAVAWLVVVSNFAFFIYLLNFSGGMFDNLLAPNSTYIIVSNMVPYRILYSVLSLFLQAAWCFPAAMTLTISVIFSFQFRQLTTQLRKLVDEQNESGVFYADIEEIRQQHQQLCRSVERADHFLKIYNLAGFFGPLTGIITILYILIFSQSMLQQNRVLVLIYTFWMACSILQLSLTAASGIMVNHTVCAIFVVYYIYLLCVLF